MPSRLPAKFGHSPPSVPCCACSGAPIHTAAPTADGQPCPDTRPLAVFATFLLVNLPTIAQPARGRLTGRGIVARRARLTARVREALRARPPVHLPRRQAGGQRPAAVPHHDPRSRPGWAAPGRPSPRGPRSRLAQPAAKPRSQARRNASAAGAGRSSGWSSRPYSLQAHPEPLLQKAETSTPKCRQPFGRSSTQACRQNVTCCAAVRVAHALRGAQRQEDDRPRAGVRGVAARARQTRATALAGIEPPQRRPVQPVEDLDQQVQHRHGEQLVVEPRLPHAPPGRRRAR